MRLYRCSLLGYTVTIERSERKKKKMEEAPIGQVDFLIGDHNVVLTLALSFYKSMSTSQLLLA